MMLLAWWRLARGEHAVMTFLAVTLAGYLVTRDVASILYAALGPALITAGSFILNDWFDYKSDKANRRYDRPLVKGEIGKQKALRASIILLIGGVALTFFVNTPTFILALAYTAAAVLYSPLLKKLPLAGNAFIASSMSISFLYANLAASMPLHPLIFLWIVIAFLMGLGRELIITLRDVKGDKKTGALTVPMIIGPKATSIASSMLIISSVALTVLPLAVKENIAYAITVAIADLLLLLAVFKTLSSQEQSVLKEARELTLRGMLVGLVAFAALALA